MIIALLILGSLPFLWLAGAIMDLGAYYSHQSRLKERARDLRTIFTTREAYSVRVEMEAYDEQQWT